MLLLKGIGKIIIKDMKQYNLFKGTPVCIYIENKHDKKLNESVFHKILDSIKSI